MFNLFIYIKALYTKNLYGLDDLDKLEVWQLMSIIKWLGYDENTIKDIKEVVKLIFDIEPKYLFYMLYMVIPKQDKVPFIHKVEKEEIKISDLYEEIARFLGWSERETMLNRHLLDKVVLPNKTYWRKEFGLGN
jgi:hypothetical protein